jgi:hypothetical protein
LLVGTIGSKPGAAAATVPLVAAGGMADWPLADWSIEVRPIALRLWSVAAPSRPLQAGEA